jgi:anti-anti-sigma factor
MIRSSPLDGLDVRLISDGDQHTLNLVGELDLTSAVEVQQVIERLCANGTYRIEVDLDEVIFIDCTGMRALLRAHSLCAQREIGFRITAASPTVERLFLLTGITTLTGGRSVQPRGVRRHRRLGALARRTHGQRRVAIKS